MGIEWQKLTFVGQYFGIQRDLNSKMRNKIRIIIWDRRKIANRGTIAEKLKGRNKSLGDSQFIE